MEATYNIRIVHLNANDETIVEKFRGTLAKGKERYTEITEHFGRVATLYADSVTIRSNSQHRYSLDCAECKRTERKCDNCILFGAPAIR